MKQAIIIEDEKLSADRLRHQITKLKNPVDVVAQLGSVSESQEWFRDNSAPDLIFLDIQLGDGTAFELLDACDIDSPIIFTTAYDEFALKAFEYNSIDYLLKPVEMDKLEQALNKLEKKTEELIPLQRERVSSLNRILNGDFKKRFLVKTGDQYTPVNTSGINYFYYENGSTWIRTGTDKRYLIDHSLDQVEQLINPIDFYRINRQFIISPRSIAEIHTYFNSRLLVKLTPDYKEDIVVSRDRVGDFKKWMDL